MKKVIIITRDSANTYHNNCEASKKNKTELYTAGAKCIHDYIRTYINDLKKNPSERGWDKVTQKGVLNTYKELWGADLYESYTTEAREKGIDPLSKPKWREKQISSKLNEALIVKDNKGCNKPYLYFEHNGFGVHFVFLNRIFDTFVNGSEEYGALIDDEHRLDFIKAIGQDCELIDKSGNLNGERAILYIHDKEWYVSGAPYTAMQNGNYTKMAKSPIEQQKELQKYFDTIKVFLHIPSPFFDEIKSLNFNDYDIDLDILERRHY